MATSISSSSNNNGQAYRSPSGSGMSVHGVKDALDKLLLAYTSQQQVINTESETLAQVEAQQSALAEQIDGFNDSIATIAQENEAIAAQQTATSNKVASIDASLATIAQQNDAIAAQQTTTNNQISTLSADFAALLQQYGTIAAQQSATNNKVATFSADLAAIAAQQSSFVDQIAAATAKNTAMAQQYAALSAGFAALQEQINGLSNAFNWKSYQPALKGSTSDPNVTYAYRTGRYIEVGKLIIFFCNFQTSNITKPSGLTDALRISLPVACGSSHDIEATSTTVSTALGGIVGNTAYIRAGANHLEVGKGVMGSAIGLLNYSLTGLGALNSAITYIAAGVYERA